MSTEISWRLLNREQDDDFLWSLYCTTRADEIALWSWQHQQVSAFLRFQYTAQTQSYTSAMPDAEHRIVCESGVPIGQSIVDRRSDSIHLVDISLLPNSRQRGIGAGLLKALMAEAQISRQRITLNVRKDNRAARLYLRTGFAVVGESELDFRMEWSPALPQQITGNLA